MRLGPGHRRNDKLVEGNAGHVTGYYSRLAKMPGYLSRGGLEHLDAGNFQYILQRCNYIQSLHLPLSGHQEAIRRVKFYNQPILTLS